MPITQTESESPGEVTLGQEGHAFWNSFERGTFDSINLHSLIKGNLQKEATQMFL